MNSLIKLSGGDFWKNYMIHYFGEELIEKWEKNVQEKWISSIGQKIHLEIYASNKEEFPVIIFSHGIAGYARLMLPFVIPLFELGYTVIAPDLQGYGYNKDTKGKFSFKNQVQNLKDVVEYAKKTYNGAIILSGASMGGPLAYAAGCNNENVNGIACWCLWEMNDPQYIKYNTRIGRMYPILKPFFKICSIFLGFLRISTNWIVPYNTLSDVDSYIPELILKDPQAGKKITIKGALSLISECTPEIPYEQLSKPIFVAHPENDRMVSLEYSQKLFKRIETVGLANKKFLIIKNCEHFPIKKQFYDQFISQFHNLLQSGFFAQGVKSNYE